MTYSVQLEALRGIVRSARTLRERALCHMLVWVWDYGAVELRLWQETPGPQKARDWHVRVSVKKLDLTARELLSVLERERREELDEQILYRPHYDGWEIAHELHHGLQDLAEIIAQEGAMALGNQYYPGVDWVDVSDDYVKRVIESMQAELDRESVRRGREAARYDLLPWERQRALVERRVAWFIKFGVDLERWRKGVWSLWRVPDEPPPEGYELPTPLAWLKLD